MVISGWPSKIHSLHASPRTACTPCPHPPPADVGRRGIRTSRLARQISALDGGRQDLQDLVHPGSSRARNLPMPSGHFLMMGAQYKLDRTTLVTVHWQLASGQCPVRVRAPTTTTQALQQRMMRTRLQSPARPATGTKLDRMRFAEIDRLRDTAHWQLATDQTQVSRGGAHVKDTPYTVHCQGGPIGAWYPTTNVPIL